MATAVRPLTYDDLDEIPQDPEGYRHEITYGVLVLTSSPIPLHQIVSGELSGEFGSFVQPRRGSRVIGPPIDVDFAPD